MLTGYSILIFWIVVGVIAIIASIIHLGIAGDLDCFDIEDFFDDFVWVTLLVCLAIGGIVFGFLNWYWWAMLLILGGIIAVAIPIIIIVLSVRRKEEKAFEEEIKKVVEEKEQTSYNCPNCAAKITKIIRTDYYGHKKIKYVCEHCNTTLNKGEVLAFTNPDTKIEAYDLDDWEEEYFDACETLNFKPHNHHSEKQIDRKVESLQERIDNGEDIYEVDDYDYDQEDILNTAYDFFIENTDEIDEYLEQHTKEEIQKRYNYFLSLHEFEEDEDE